MHSVPWGVPAREKTYRKESACEAAWHFLCNHWLFQSKLPKNDLALSQKFLVLKVSCNAMDKRNGKTLQEQVDYMSYLERRRNTVEYTRPFYKKPNSRPSTQSFLIFGHTF